jgi:hypothetical protein
VIFCFAREKIWRGGMWFLLGNMAFLQSQTMVKRGQVVVDCVVNVVG